MHYRVPAVALVMLLSACSGTAGQSPDGSRAVTASATAEASLSEAPTATATAAPSPSARAAADYPYSLRWPADELESEWRFATTAWDGTSRIDHGNQYTDSVETSSGSLFAFGLPVSGGPEELRDLVSQQAATWHGCDEEPSEEEPLSGGGEDGIYGEYACGSRTVLRWFGTHDGFGLFVGLIADLTVDVDAAATRFKDRIGELEWAN